MNNQYTKFERKSIVQFYFSGMTLKAQFSEERMVKQDSLSIFFDSNLSALTVISVSLSSIKFTVNPQV